MGHRVSCAARVATAEVSTKGSAARPAVRSREVRADYLESRMSGLTVGRPLIFQRVGPNFLQSAISVHKSRSHLDRTQFGRVTFPTRDAPRIFPLQRRRARDR